MRSYMARLGDFQFSLDTAPFQDYQRSSGYRWEEKPRIGRESALQFTGLESETITLTGVIYPHFRGGLGQMEAMRQQAGQGVPLPFIYSSEFVGQYMGRWCIRSIDEGRTVFFEDGKPRRIDFRVTLSKYGDDDSGGPLPNALVGAGALSGGLQ